MFVRDLNHYNVRVPAALFTTVRDFYREALGLHEGEHFQENWLYAGSKPVLHLGPIETEADIPVASAQVSQGSTGWIDHVAFTCSGLPEARARLESLGVGYEVMDVPFLDLTQLVVHDPAGIKIELQFPGEHPV